MRSSPTTSAKCELGRRKPVFGTKRISRSVPESRRCGNLAGRHWSSLLWCSDHLRKTDYSRGRGRFNIESRNSFISEVLFIGVGILVWMSPSILDQASCSSGSRRESPLQSFRAPMEGGRFCPRRIRTWDLQCKPRRRMRRFLMRRRDARCCCRIIETVSPCPLEKSVTMIAGGARKSRMPRACTKRVRGQVVPTMKQIQLCVLSGQGPSPDVT